MPDQVLPVDSLIGLEFSHYRISEQIGSGGMGVVFRAHDNHLEREVAIKVLHPGTITDEVARKHLHKEALALSKLNHPNIATIYDFDGQRGIDFLVMEYIPGITLNRKLAAGSLPEKEVIRLGVQLAEGLSAAHEHGVVHRDLKPGNLRLTEDGRLKILDFGLAKFWQPVPECATAESLSETHAMAGTLPYMAPEQLLGAEIDARTDIHAAGSVLYEMATGQRPFAEVPSAHLIGAILRSTPAEPRTLNPKLSPDLERIIGKCLEKEPENRYQSAKELAVDLFRLGRDTRPVPSSSRDHIVNRSSWIRLNRSVLLWAAIVVAVVLAAVALLGPMRQQLRSRLGLSPIPHEKQVAVLPFSVVGSDPETAAFGAGLTETLTAKLTQLTGDPSLQVVPATEIRAKHVSTVDDARKEFGANLALEGSLHKSGEQVRVNYILVDAHSLRQIRASSITVVSTDPFGAEDAVVDGAIRMLDLKVQAHERLALESHGTQVARAYDYYLQGRGYLQNYDRAENLDSAIQVFERALALDSSYALAFAGLGDAYWKKYEDSKESAWIEKSRKACEQANRLDGRLSSAHVCLGTLYIGTGNYQEAVVEFEHAVENEPTNDAAFHGLADAYERLGKLQDAENTYRRAIDLRPHYWASYNWLGVFFYRQARFGEAAKMFSQVVALSPDSFRGYSNLGAAYVEQARYDEAIGVLDRSIVIRPTAYGYTNLGNAYFFLRRYEEADRAYEQAVKLTENDSLLWWNLGDGYYWTPGKRSQSMAAYRQAIAIAEEDLRVNPKDSDAYGVLAICHAMLEEKKPALDALQRGLQLLPHDPSLLFEAAIVHNQFDQPDEVIDWLKKAVAAGYSPSRIRDLPNFEALRNKPQFQQLLQAN
jgi:serine/threonine protein kinase/tetratricopeptide (TPR) repeat protein